MLHPNYDLIRSLVDSVFVGYRRRSRRDGLDMERIEMWHDLLEAGLKADPHCPHEPGSSEWAGCILSHVEACYLKIAK